MIDLDGARRHGTISAILAGAFGLLIAAGILMWSWNTLAAGLFGGPAATFLDAIAAEAALLVVLGIATASLRLGRRHPGERGR